MTRVMHRSCFCPWERLAAVLRNNRVIALRQAHDKTVRMACLRRCYRSLPRVASGFPMTVILSRMVPALSQVSCSTMPYPARRLCLVISRISTSFYRDGAAVYIIKPHQQVDHRRFAASGGSDNRHALAWLYLQIEILNELLLRRIGKRNVLQLHFPIHMLQRNRIFQLPAPEIFLRSARTPVPHRRSRSAVLLRRRKFH